MYPIVFLTSVEEVKLLCNQFFNFKHVIPLYKPKRKLSTHHPHNVPIRALPFAPYIPISIDHFRVRCNYLETSCHLLFARPTPSALYIVINHPRYSSMFYHK